MGRCYTLRPKEPTKRVSKSVGYSLLLEHARSTTSTSDVDTGTAGWHVFIHEKKENFTGECDLICRINCKFNINIPFKKSI